MAAIDGYIYMMVHILIRRGQMSRNIFMKCIFETSAKDLKIPVPIQTAVDYSRRIHYYHIIQTVKKKMA